MKKLIVSTAFLMIMSVTAQALAHGGGCRKSSPQGQCCHMETRTGIVHCH